MDIDLLSKMVKDLILDNDEVSLPGVGTFVAELVPSTFSDKGYTINPPYRRLYFRQRKDTSDTALVELYAKANNIDEERSKQIIDDFLSEMKDVLRQKKTIIFPGLGRLRATKENNIFFVADEDLDIYPSGFGLNPISLKTHVETSEEVAAAVASLKDLVVPSVSSASSPSTAPVPDETEKAAEETPEVPSPAKEIYEEPKVSIFSPVAVHSEPKPIPEGMEDSLAAGETEPETKPTIVPSEETESQPEPVPEVNEPMEELSFEENKARSGEGSTIDEQLKENPIEEERETVPEELSTDDLPETLSPSLDTETEEVSPSGEETSSIETGENTTDEEPVEEPSYEEEAVPQPALPEEDKKDEEDSEEEVIPLSEADDETGAEVTADPEITQVAEETASEEVKEEEPVTEESVEEEVSVPAIVEEKPVQEEKTKQEGTHTADAKAMSDKVAAMIKEKKAVVTTPSVLNEPEKKEGLPLWAKILIWIFGILLALLIIYMIVARVAPNFIDSILYSPEDLEFLREGKI
ncbi:MAG: hypothetical protein IJ161_15570 [Bacteroidales bacterium]|nr:hypothetical protein [Bacteroidales bacterium]MBQ9175136.1 hypothetical protein [Bacteroidales bacterium]